MLPKTHCLLQLQQTQTSSNIGHSGATNTGTHPQLSTWGINGHHHFSTWQGKSFYCWWTIAAISETNYVEASFIYTTDLKASSSTLVSAQSLRNHNTLMRRESVVWSLWPCLLALEVNCFNTTTRSNKGYFKHTLDKATDVDTHLSNTACLPSPVPNTTWKVYIQFWAATTAHGHADTPEVLLLCTRRLLNLAPNTSTRVHCYTKKKHPQGGLWRNMTIKTPAQHTAQA